MVSLPEEGPDTSISDGDEKGPSVNANVFPTKNLLVFGEDRKVTSMWLSESIHSAFIDACKLSGRKTCDVIEPFERAYVEAVKKTIIEGKVESCFFNPIVINLTLNVTEKYRKRGPKGNSWDFFCGQYRHSDKPFCIHKCRYGYCGDESCIDKVL